eukprot:4020425-Pleurochrysis_carterae.AAC.1
MVAAATRWVRQSRQAGGSVRRVAKSAEIGKEPKAGSSATSIASFASKSTNDSASEVSAVPLALRCRLAASACVDMRAQQTENAARGRAAAVT